MRTQTSLRARDWQKATRTTTSTSAVPPDAQRQWLPDTELPGYELLPIPLPDEPTYALEPDGSLVATVVRRSHPVSRRAVLYVHGAEGSLAERVADLQTVIGKTVMAFEILVLKNKILSR